MKYCSLGGSGNAEIQRESSEIIQWSCISSLTIFGTISFVQSGASRIIFSKLEGIVFQKKWVFNDAKWVILNCQTFVEKLERGSCA